MRSVVLAMMLLGAGCAGAWEREAATVRRIREHYAQTPLAVEPRELKRRWDSLEPTAPMGCLSLSRPCRVVEASSGERLCFAWGDERACFTLGRAPKDDGVVLQRADQGEGSAIERWVYSSVDPAFSGVQASAEQAADAEVSATEQDPVDANSFWASTRLLVTIPSLTVSQNVQVGYRRWFERSVILSAGAGYERLYAAASPAGEPRDAVLFTARVELSDWKWALKYINVPAISLYFGITGALGVAPEVTWSTRSFVGFSAIVPLSLELGYSVSALPSVTLQNLAVSIGLAL